MKAESGQNPIRVKTNKEMLELWTSRNWEGLIRCLENKDWDPNAPLPIADSDAVFHLLVGAAEDGNRDLAEALLRHGATVDLRDRGWRTPLMMACVGGHESVVDLLLKAKPRLDTKCGGQTAMMMAAEYGYVGVVRKLLDAGANVDVRSHSGMSAISYAVSTRSNHSETLSVLLEAGCQVDGRDLHVPVANRDSEMVSKLVAKGADVNTEYDWNTAGNDVQKGDTPLLVAVADTGIETLRRAGAAFGEDKDTERLAIIDLLLRSGANPNVQRRMGGATPLIYAALYDSVEVAERLIKAGSRPEQEFECSMIRFPFSQPKTPRQTVLSAIKMAEMRPRNKRIRKFFGIE
jgi:ankyrin repeat protein